MKTAGHTNNPLFPFGEVAPTTFETARLRLRAATVADLGLIFDLYGGDPIATKYMAWPRATTPEDARPFWEMVDASFRSHPKGAVQFAWLLQLKQTGEYIGSCGIGSQAGTTVGGGYILNPAFWGQGYAAEAWTPVVAWAKAQPSIERIEAAHHQDNPASGAVMRKVGLSFDRIEHREGGYPNLGQTEEAVDTLIYAWVRDS
jgi:ribosomal-protein-alanine N-acetyltransferase